MSTDMVRLTVDFENPAPEWWEGGACGGACGRRSATRLSGVG